MVSEFVVQAFLAVVAFLKSQKRLPVILGRDAWPLVPMLRCQGIRCVYQMISRKSQGLPATIANFLAEVPPKALIVDTGYRGSIIDALRAHDNSLTGVVMCGEGKYPEILGADARVRIVEEIEHQPKIVGRARFMRGSKVVCFIPGRDHEDRDQVLPTAQTVERNFELLRALGCPFLEAIKYARFMGVTREERLGLKGKELETYLRKVAQARKRGTRGRFEEIGAALTAAFDYGQRDHLARIVTEEAKDVESYYKYSYYKSIFNTIVYKFERLQRKIVETHKLLGECPRWDRDLQEELQAKLERYLLRWERYHSVLPEEFLSCLPFSRNPWKQQKLSLYHYPDYWS